MAIINLHKNWKSIMTQANPDPTEKWLAEEDETAKVEHELLQRLAQGDTAVFWEIWQRHQNSTFFRYCLWWMSGNYEDAEDALSLASLKACKGLQVSANEISSVKGWIIRLLHNHCIDLCRARERRIKSLQRFKDIEGVSGKTPAQQESVEDIILRREISLFIRQAIDDLPPRLREASQLRFVHDMPCRDIASQLNLSPENVRKRLQQARAILQTSLMSIHK